MGFEGLLGAIFEVFQSFLMETILSFITDLLGQILPFAPQ
jgi:hypothetical protein